MHLDAERWFGLTAAQLGESVGWSSQSSKAPQPNRLSALAVDAHDDLEPSTSFGLTLRRLDDMSLDHTSSGATSLSSPQSTSFPSAASSTAPSSAPSASGSDDDNDEKTSSQASFKPTDQDLGGPLDERRHFPLLDWGELSPWMKYAGNLLSSHLLHRRLTSWRACSFFGLRDFESEYTIVGYRRQQNSVLGCFYSAVGCDLRISSRPCSAGVDPAAAYFSGAATSITRPSTS